MPDLSQLGDLVFIGEFSSGQTVSAQMIGEAIDCDPRSGSAVAVSRPRDPKVEGPRGILLRTGRPGRLTFIAPSTGSYHFSFSPCAMRGTPMRICAYELYRELLFAGTKAVPTTIA